MKRVVVGVLVMGAGLAWAGSVEPDSLPLPPPPARAGLPQPAAPAREAEEIWSDNATATKAVIPAVPLRINRDAAIFKKTPPHVFGRDITKNGNGIGTGAGAGGRAGVDYDYEHEHEKIPAKAGTPELQPSPTPVDQVLAAIRREAPKSATLESMLFDQLRAALPQGSEGTIFEKVTLPNVTNLPGTGWKVRYDFRLPARGIGQTPFTGSLVDANERVLRTFSGSVTIDREADGIQVTRVIHRGETLNPGDVRLMGTRLSQLPRGAVDQLEKLSGTIASQELRPGMWLTEQMLKIPEVIKQAQPVTMMVLHGPIRIVAPGIARQAGAIGDTIRVENAHSQRIIYARVLSKDEVQVVF